MKLLGRFFTIFLVSVLSFGALPASAAPTGLYGKVVNSLSKPIPGTQIIVSQSGQTIASVTTAADGSYNVPVVNGTYSVSYRPPTDANSRLEAYGIAVPQKASMNIMLTPPTPGAVFLSGTVSFSNGMVPAADSTVYFGGYQGTVNTAKFFKVKANAGSRGTYTLKTSSGATFAARLYGQDAFDLNQDTLANFVIPVTTQRIRVLTPDGKPVAGALVEAGQGRFGSEIATMKPIDGLGTIKANWDNSGKTDANGYVTLTVVQMAAPSDAGFQVTPPAALKYERESFIRTTGTGDVILTVTKPSGLLTGTVKDQLGTAFSNLWVNLGDKVITATNSTGLYSKAGANGTTGSFRLFYQAGSEKAAYDFFTLEGSSADRTVVNGTTTQNFVIRRDSMTVNVVSPDGQPMANAFVTLYGNNSYVPLGKMTLVADKPAYNANFITKGYTNAQGVVTFKTLHYDTVIDGFMDVVPSPTSAYAGTRVNLKVGDGAPVTVTLPRPTVNLSGTVKFSDGTPMANGKLTFSYAYTSDTVTTAVGADGKYSFNIAKGTRGTWTFKCDAIRPSELTSPLCVDFVAPALSPITSNLVTDLVLPTRSASIKVVDQYGVPIPGVSISYDKVYVYSPCYEGVRLSNGAFAGDINPMAKATTDASGQATLAAVESPVACDTVLSLDPGVNSRYEARDIAINLNSGDENIIVLSIQEPVITAASMITDAKGVTKAYVSGRNLLGTFEVKIGDLVISDFKVTNNYGLWFIVPDVTAARGALLTVTQGGGSATAILG